MRSSFRGAGVAREPGIQEHRLEKAKHRLMFMDSRPGPAGHPGMTTDTVRTLYLHDWHSFTRSQAGIQRGEVAATDFLFSRLSGHGEFGHEHLALGLRAQQQGDDHADRG